MTSEFITERRYMKGVSAKTLAWYHDSFHAFEGALDSKQAIVQRVKELTDRGVKPVSINTYLRCVNAYLRWLNLEKGAEKLKIPRLKEEQKILETLSEPAILSLLAFRPKLLWEKRCHAIILLLLDTGLRANEALSLTSEDVDFDNMLILAMGKGQKQRLVPFSSELRKLLWRYTQAQVVGRWVFGTKSNTKLSVRNLERDFKKLGKKVGISGVRFSPHTMRHTFAVNYLRKGGNVFYLQRILGHTTLEMTNRYVRSLGIEDLKAVHNGLSLFGR